MPKAFIMIDVEPGREKEVREAVATVGGVQFVYEVTGEHDMIAFVEAEPYNNFAVVVETIRRVDGIKDTATELVLR